MLLQSEPGQEGGVEESEESAKDDVCQVTDLQRACWFNSMLKSSKGRQGKK